MVRAFAARAITVGLVLAGGLAVAAGPVEAAKPCNGKARASEVPSAKVIDAATRAMSMKGASDSEVDAWLQDELCLEKVGSEPITTLGGVGNGDVSWTTGVYRDNSSGRYLVKGTWKWNNHDYGSDYSAWLYGCYGSSIGGLDGVGISLAAPGGAGFNIYGVSASGWGDPALDRYSYDYGNWTTSSAWKTSAYGIAFRKQDHARIAHGNYCSSIYNTYVDSDWFAGQTFMWVKSKSGCKSNTQVHTLLSHTWKSTSVSSVSFSATGLGFGWSGGDAQWDWGKAGTVATIC